METISLITGLFIIALGLIIKHGKLYFLIAGYNTMTKEEKQKIDIEKLATLMRNVFISIGLVIIGGYFLARLTDIKIINLIAVIVSVAVGIPYLIIKANKLKK